MKFEPSLQLKTRTTPGNRQTCDFYAHWRRVRWVHEVTPSARARWDHWGWYRRKEEHKASLQFRAESYQLTSDCWMSKLDCVSHQTRHSMGYKSSSMFDHTWPRHMLHSSQAYLSILGDASFAPTGEKSQPGLIAYHGITSHQRKGGNLVQWRSSRQDLIAKSTCEAEWIASSEALQQGENIATVVAEMINKSCDIEVASNNAGSLHMIRNGSETAWRTRHISVKALWLHQMARRGTKFTYQSTSEMAADSLTKGLGASRLPQIEKTYVSLKTTMSRSWSMWFSSTSCTLSRECLVDISNCFNVSLCDIQTAESSEVVYNVVDAHTTSRVVQDRHGCLVILMSCRT